MYTPSLTAITMAKRLAINAVRRDLQAKGQRRSQLRVIELAARDYLREHPELIAEAAETVSKVPGLRTMAERDDRQRAKSLAWIERKLRLTHDRIDFVIDEVFPCRSHERKRAMR